MHAVSHVKLISELSEALLCSELSGAVKKLPSRGAVETATFRVYILFSVYLPNGVSYFLNGKIFL